MTFALCFHIKTKVNSAFWKLWSQTYCIVCEFKKLSGLLAKLIIENIHGTASSLQIVAITD